MVVLVGGRTNASSRRCTNGWSVRRRSRCAADVAGTARRVIAYQSTMPAPKVCAHRGFQPQECGPSWRTRVSGMHRLHKSALAQTHCRCGHQPGPPKPQHPPTGEKCGLVYKSEAPAPGVCANQLEQRFRLIVPDHDSRLILKHWRGKHDCQAFVRYPKARGCGHELWQQERARLPACRITRLGRSLALPLCQNLWPHPKRGRTHSTFAGRPGGSTTRWLTGDR